MGKRGKKIVTYSLMLFVMVVALFGFVLPALFSAKSDLSVFAGVAVLVVFLRMVIIKIVELVSVGRNMK